jgi:hypothetical protein
MPDEERTKLEVDEAGEHLTWHQNQNRIKMREAKSCISAETDLVLGHAGSRGNILQCLESAVVIHAEE